MTSVWGYNLNVKTTVTSRRNALKRASVLLSPAVFAPLPGFCDEELAAPPLDEDATFGKKTIEAKIEGMPFSCTYDLPLKWKNRSGSSFSDSSLPGSPPVCSSIAVSALPQETDLTAIGGDVGKLCKAFQIKDSKQVDLISASKTTVEGTLYYEYDLAYAPPKCDNRGIGGGLGLGFCPYTKVYLVKATDDHVAFIGEATDAEWKVGNGDFKAVRKSWIVTKDA